MSDYLEEQNLLFLYEAFGEDWLPEIIQLNKNDIPEEGIVAAVELEFVSHNDTFQEKVGGEILFCDSIMELINQLTDLEDEEHLELVDAVYDLDSEEEISPEKIKG